MPGSRRHLNCVPLLALILVSPLIAASPASTPKAIRLRALVVGEGSVLKDAVVVVEGERIVSVGGRDTQVPPGSEVIDLRRYTGIPGLIDVHTHMTYHWDPSSGLRPFDPIHLDQHPAVTVFMAQGNAMKTLEAGVTTVRDLGGREYADIAMRDLINRGAFKGPRMFVSGHGLHINYAPARSHLDFPYAGVAAGTAEVMRIVRQEVYGAGADWVKMLGSTGTGADVSGRQTFTFEEMKAAADAAHALGVRNAIHSYGPEGARSAVLAGADSVEHAVDLDDATLAEMVKRGTFYVPTVDHNRYYAEHAEEYGYGPEAVAGLKAFIERNVETVRRAHQAGVRIAMGADALFTMFGENARELGWFVKAGMTPAEALATATTSAARLLGKEKELGAVAPGYYADLVAVEGDPLADIQTVIDKVRWVMKGGSVMVDRTGERAR